MAKHFVICQKCCNFARDLNHEALTSTDYILNYASQHQRQFRRADIISALSLEKDSVARFDVQLKRMVTSGRIVHLGHGIYSLPQNSKPVFQYQPSEQEVEIAKQIKGKFPFIEFCIWNSFALTSFMQHVPAPHIMFVDVERVAMDAVFSFLRELNLSMSLLLNPDKTECERYITTDEVIVVRPLVNEAPCTVNGSTPIPTIEKMLVDTNGDKELSFMHGAELYTIYKNVFELYDVNCSKLLRYASRRNRKEKVKQILITENL